MHHILLKDDKGHALPYDFWLALVFKYYSIPVQVWFLQTTKDSISTVNHVVLHSFMRCVGNPLQRMRNALAIKTAELEATHEAERMTLLVPIDVFQANLARE